MTHKQRLDRMTQLKHLAEIYASVNPEQAEAYADRLNMHWRKLLDKIEKEG